MVVLNIYTDATVMSGEGMYPALKTCCDTVSEKGKTHPTSGWVGFVSGFTVKFW